MTKALDCLRLSKPDLPSDLKYPDDAWEHYLEIHDRLGRFAFGNASDPHLYAGFKGPWIENQFIAHFQEALHNGKKSLPTVFGPYIPMFIPWTDIWLKWKFKYPKDLIDALGDVLRDDVLYITVVQMDEGFVGNCWQLYQWQNEKHITVLSTGGYGHLSIPLLKQPEPALRPKISRQHVVSYVGSVGGMAGSMREKMLEPGYYYYLGDEWRNVMAQSKFSLCPRGVGRTSFHVFESLQMGLIPIQVYEDEDEPWLPHGDLMNNMSFAVTVSELPTLVEKLSIMSDSEVTAMEANIDDLRNVYFSFDGVLREIGKFMLGGIYGDDESKLVCRKLPSNSGTPQFNPNWISCTGDGPGKQVY